METALSKADVPAIIVFLSNNERWEKDLPSFIITPLKPPSLISVFDPIPKTLIFLKLLISFKKKDRSFRLCQWP